MYGLRSISILALALPLTAAASEPEARHGAPPEEAHGAARAGPDCPARLGEQDGAPRFADYPAPRPSGRWVAPVLGAREARMYRSTLGAEAANGPNFAGNYTIAAWGCGYACSSAAIINLANGRTAFPADLGRISTARVRDWVSDQPLRYRGMRFRPDSRLLIVIGSASGDETDDRAVYYEWTGTTLRHLAAVPRAGLCPR